MTIAVAVAVAGCGGGPSSPTVASVTTSGSNPVATTAATADPVAFSKCMRDDGIANFPDPNANGQYDLPTSVDPSSQAFKDALQDCQQYSSPTEAKPTDAWSRDAQLRYAKCMREHGIPNFADPDDNGSMFLPSGVDPSSQTVLDAQQACQQYQPANQPPRNDGGAS